MQVSKLILISALAAAAVFGVAQAQVVDGVVEQGPAQTGEVLEQALETAVEIAEDFEVGDVIPEEAADLVITDESTAALVIEIATDEDVINEEEERCCPEGSFCCGMELGCLPDALAPEVMCPVQGPDNPGNPCCRLDLPTV